MLKENRIYMCPTDIPDPDIKPIGDEGEGEENEEKKDES